MPTPVILVNHPIGDRKPGIKAYQDQNWIRTQPYLHTPFSSMHMKVRTANGHQYPSIELM
jgi:hypothetical protein